MTNKTMDAVHAFLAIAGTTIVSWLGGWDMPLRILVLFMIIDYFSGIAAAYKTKTLDSNVMFWGGIRKTATLVVIIIATELDILLAGTITQPIFRTLSVFYYLSREGLSITENFGILNVPMPQQVKDALAQLNTSQDKTNGGNK